MRCKIRHLLSLTILLCLIGGHINAAITFKNGKFYDSAEVPTMSCEEHFNTGLTAFHNCDWREAVVHFRVVFLNFPDSPDCPDATFYLGVAYYNTEEFDFANETFTSYLKEQNCPQFFQEAIEYKLAIAEKFSLGHKKHLFGFKRLPKWASGHSLAEEIYDEIIAVLPCHELGAKALYAKGFFLWENKQYRESVDAFQLLIRRFPRHELTPECYLTINRVYLQQSQCEFQNPDILALAQINYRKFKQAFPREERLQEAEADVMMIKEIYAAGFYNTGQFYERTNKPHASIIYYQNAVNQFPDTQIAKLAQARLLVLQPPSEEPEDTCISPESCAAPSEKKDDNDIQKKLAIKA